MDVVALAGHAGSGKSTQSARLAERFHGHRASFGDLIRDRTRIGGLDSSDRQVLMDEGHRWATDDPAGMVVALLGTIPPSTLVLVIDGVRHVAVLDALTTSLGSPLHLIYLDASEAALRKRLSAEVADPLSHPSEAEMPRLMALADLVVDGEEPIDQVTSTVCFEAKSWFPTLAALEGNARS